MQSMSPIGHDARAAARPSIIFDAALMPDIGQVSLEKSRATVGRPMSMRAAIGSMVTCHGRRRRWQSFALSYRAFRQKPLSASR